MRKAEFNKNDFNKIAETSSELENLNLIIDDNPILTIPALRARARRLKRLHNINLIIIDYLQLIYPLITVMTVEFRKFLKLQGG